MITARSAQELGYEVFDVVASGGMASVHLGRRRGAAGFSRVVAVKRLHPHLASDPDLVAMLSDEARLSARIRHSNVVSVLDVIEDGGLALVMEYVHGGSLAELLRAASALGESVPPAIASAIVVGGLAGLHAAHEARGDDGAPLGIVHRDVSPQNILVGADGLARIVDFGVAKARVRSYVTREGSLKGKLAYMAPEQLVGQATRQSDVLAMGVVAWEMFAGRRFYEGISDEAHLLGAVSLRAVPPLRQLAPGLSEAAVRAVETALQKETALRFATAEDMANALRIAVPPAPPHEVGAWTARLLADKLAQRAASIARIERGEAPAFAAAGAAFGSAGAISERTPGRAAFASGSGTSSFDPRQNADPSGTVTIDPVLRRSEAEQRARKSRARWLGAAALVIAAASVVGLVLRFGGGTQAAADIVSASAANSQSGASSSGVSVPPGGADPAAPSSAVATGSDAPAASAGATAKEAPTSAAAAPPGTGSPASAGRGTGFSGASNGRPAVSAAPKGTSAVLAPVPGCDPPWELDPQGIKRIKRACLK